MYIIQDREDKLPYGGIRATSKFVGVVLTLPPILPASELSMIFSRLLLKDVKIPLPRGVTVNEKKKKTH